MRLELGPYFIGMPTDQVPPTPPPLDDANHALVAMQTRALQDHADRDAKGFGFMLGCMDATTRQMILDRCGSTTDVANPALPMITIVKGTSGACGCSMRPSCSSLKIAGPSKRPWHLS